MAALQALGDSELDCHPAWAGRLRVSAGNSSGCGGLGLDHVTSSVIHTDAMIIRAQAESESPGRGIMASLSHCMIVGVRVSLQPDSGVTESLRPLARVFT